MRIIENIKKKLFTEFEILEQRQVEDCNITRFKVFGTARPRIFVDGIINIDVKVKIENGKKLIFEKKFKKEEQEISIVERLSIWKPNVILTVYEKNRVLLKYRLNNSFIRKFFKKIYTICKLFYRAVRLLWKRHHFLVPPKMIGYYLRALRDKVQWEESNINCIDPFNVEEYNEWIAKHEIHESVKELKYNPKFSIVVPVYNAPINYLEECMDSVIGQNYKNWELCIADDKSTDPKVKETLEKYKKKDKRIKVVYRKENGNISKATNSAFELATGDYISLLDNDDTLSKDALYEVAKVLNKDKEIDFIYSDEDKINTSGLRCDPYFKPDFSPDTLLSNNYICHLTTFSKKLLDEVGGEKSEYDGAQDYDLILRLTEKAKKIYHISKILYHWRIIPGSTSENISAKPKAVDAGKRALEAALKRRKIEGFVDSSNNDGTYIVNYKIGKPKVSIIIPTRDYKDILEICLKSIYKKTTYDNYEIIIIDNNSEKQETFDLFDKYKKEHKNFKVKRLECEFNYSYLNNEAVKIAEGEYIILLNNDTEVITNDWIEKMLMYASRPHVGAVGVKLLYPDNTIQHGGLILGINGIASHAYINADRNSHGHFGRLIVPYNYDGSTAACLMVSKKKYQEVGGLEEELKVNFNDVDFNLKLLEKGYYNLFVPTVELYHYESKSRGLDLSKEKLERTKQETTYMLNKWNKKLVNSRFYNKNYSKHFVYMLEK